MKKLLIILICTVMARSATAQMKTDSIHRHELGFNISPAVIVMAGAPPGESGFGLLYRYYTRSNKVLRARFSVFPFRELNPLYGQPVYDRTVGDRNVFRTYSLYLGPKWMLSLGGEKVFRSGRLVHGYGIEVNAGYRIINIHEDYEWRDLSVKPENFYMLGDSVNRIVDTLGSYRHENQVSLGMHLFYSLRFQLSQRIYLSACLGPTFTFNRGFVRLDDRRKGKTEYYKISHFDFGSVPLITELALSFRF